MDYGERVLRDEGLVITLNAKPIQEYVIQNDNYFVIGDNLDVSMDSRYLGFITEEMIIGKALFIYWSMDSKKSAPGPLGFLSEIRASRIFKSVD
jgi:signal peptidase I